MDIDKIKHEFPVTQNRIFFDHAKVAPLPRRVMDAVRGLTEDAANFGTAHYTSWMNVIRFFQLLDRFLAAL